MSGPKCCSYRINYEREREQQRRLQEAVTRSHLLEQQFERLRNDLISAQSAYPDEKFDLKIHLPARPSERSSTFFSYVSTLDNILHSSEQRLKIAIDQAMVNTALKEVYKSLGEVSAKIPKTAAEILEEYARKNRAVPSPPDALEKRRIEALRILDRLDDAAPFDIMQELENLMRDMLTTDDLYRAESLGLELRYRVQRCNEKLTLQRKDCAEAETLLSSLPGENYDPEIELRSHLERVVLHNIPLTDDIRKRAVDLIASGKSRREQSDRERTAAIVKESLEDLGYEVDNIGSTLFVEGGVAHIHRNEWGDKYFVRFRVMPGEQRMNFNMVRVKNAGDGEDVNKKQDAAMETAWCSGYQKLMETFSARGIENCLERHVEAGAIPMQAVALAEIPTTLQKKNKKQGQNRAAQHQGTKRKRK